MEVVTPSLTNCPTPGRRPTAKRNHLESTKPANLTLKLRPLGRGQEPRDVTNDVTFECQTIPKRHPLEKSVSSQLSGAVQKRIPPDPPPQRSKSNGGEKFPGSAPAECICKFALPHRPIRMGHSHSHRGLIDQSGERKRSVPAREWMHAPLPHPTPTFFCSKGVFFSLPPRPAAEVHGV